MREKYDFCLHIESLFLLMRIGPVFLMGFCIQKFHIKDKDVFLKRSRAFKKRTGAFFKNNRMF